MRRGMVQVAIACLVLRVIACVGKDPDAPTKPTGDEGAACFTDKTCHAGLECRSDLCVLPTGGVDSATPVTPPDAAKADADSGTPPKVDAAPECEAGPCAIADLVAWFRADRGVIVAPADRSVTQWQDQSGKAHHAVLEDASTRPMLVDASSEFDGPHVVFSGGGQNTAQRLATAAFDGILTRTIFVVVATGEDFSNPVDGITGDGTGTFDTVMGVSASGVYIQAGGSPLTSDYVPDGGAFLFEGVFGGESSVIRINDDAAVAEGGAGTKPMNGLALGTGRTGSIGKFFGFEGSIAELVVYGRRLTDNERTQVITWLRSRHRFQ